MMLSDVWHKFLCFDNELEELDKLMQEEHEKAFNNNEEDDYDRGDNDDDDEDILR